ncbi:hypothetical protein [Streptomyces sp. NPDC054940]
MVSIASGPGGRDLYTARTSPTPLGELSNEVWDTVHHHRTAVLPGQ